LQAEWPVLQLQAFPGYISWEIYQRNQQRLAQNAQGKSWKRGAPLQGIAICGRCGRYSYLRGKSPRGIPPASASVDNTHTLCIYINRLLGKPEFLQIKSLAFPN
jgi:hypothetical protein